MPRQLATSRYSRAYKARLSQAYHLFVQWCASIGVSIAFPLKASLANSLLVRYVQHLFDSGATLSVASHTILSLQHLQPSLRSRLKRAWNSVWSWQLEKPLNMRRPMPHSVLQCMFATACLYGLAWEPGHAQQWLSFAIALRVGFFGLLRPSELLGLLSGCVALPSGLLLHASQQVVITITRPKTRATAGRMQFCLIHDALTIAWMEWFCVDVPPFVKLFPLSPQRFRQLWDRALESLRLGNLGLTPASLRAGGATHLFLSGVPLDRIKFAGRWKVLSSLEHYIQEAMSTLVLHHIRPEAVPLLRHLLAQPIGPLPPLAPWPAFFGRQQQIHLTRISRARHAVDTSRYPRVARS